MAKKIKIGIVGVLLALILFASLVYIRSTRPLKQAQNEAVSFAKAHIDLKKVDEFYWFTRKSNNFSIVGSLENGQEIVAFIPDSGDKIKVLAQDEGLSKEAVLAQVAKEDERPIIKYSLGMVDDTPMWEVITQAENKRLNYYLIDFKTGKVKSVLENV